MTEPKPAWNGHKPGFKLSDNTALLRFAGSRYEGAEVRVYLDVPIDYYLRITNDEPDRGLESYDDDFFSEVIIDWNLLTRSGEQVPPSAEGARKHVSPRFMNVLMGAWVRAVAEVPDPLAVPSESGVT